MCVSEWKKVEAWHSRVASLQEQYSQSSEHSSAYHLHYDINRIRSGGLVFWPLSVNYNDKAQVY